MKTTLRRFPLLLAVVALLFTVTPTAWAADEAPVASDDTATAVAPAAAEEAAEVTTEETAETAGAVDAELDLARLFAAGPKPIDSNCPDWTCSVDDDCGTECVVGTCPWPCGACVYETSEPCSGYCFCR